MFFYHNGKDWIIAEPSAEAECTTPIKGKECWSIETFNM